MVYTFYEEELFTAFLKGADAVNRDDQEADEGEDEGEVYGGVVHHRAEVNDRPLERRHNGATHNGHDEEGSTERGILRLYVFKGYSVNCGEHERHECRYSYEAVKTCHAYEEYCSRRAEHGADAEDGEQAARVYILHQEG